MNEGVNIARATNNDTATHHSLLRTVPSLCAYQTRIGELRARSFQTHNVHLLFFSNLPLHSGAE